MAPSYKYCSKEKRTDLAVYFTALLGNVICFATTGEAPLLYCVSQYYIPTHLAYNKTMSHVSSQYKRILGALSIGIIIGRTLNLIGCFQEVTSFVLSLHICSSRWMRKYNVASTLISRDASKETETTIYCVS